MRRRSLATLLCILIGIVMAGCLGDSEQPAEDYEPELGGRGGAVLTQGPQSQKVLERLEAKDYTGGSAMGIYPLNTGCGQVWFNPGGPENLGGVCFLLPDWTVSINFTIEDDMSGQLAYNWAFLDVGGFTLESGLGCSDGEELLPVEGAQSLKVGLVDVVWGSAYCASAAAPTHGTVTATVRYQR